MSGNQVPDTPEQINPEETKIPLANVEVHTVKNKKSAYSAAYIPAINRIIANGEENKYPAIIAHEAWHKHNAEAGVHDLPMSLSQHHKLRIHDEYSAYLVELVTLRQQYMEAKTPEEKSQITNSTLGKMYAPYFQAIERGEINPESTNAKDNAKEFAYMAQVSKNLYSTILNPQIDMPTLLGSCTSDEERKHIIRATEELYTASEKYQKDHKGMINQTFNTTELEDLKPNDANYQQALKTMYNIGGINFSKYIVDDVDKLLPQSTIEADRQIASGKSREEIEQTLDIHLSSKEKTKYAGIRLAKNHTLEEIEQKLQQPELSKEDKKIYKEARKQKLTEEMQEQNHMAKKYLKKAYDHPETLAIYDNESPFLMSTYASNIVTNHAQNAVNRLMSLLCAHELHKKLTDKEQVSSTPQAQEKKTLPQEDTAKDKDQTPVMAYMQNQQTM